MIRFPDFVEVPLRRSPLAEVICQVRFPPVLEIDQEETIAQFQKVVKAQFPYYKMEQRVMSVALTSNGEEVPRSLPQHKIHRFKSSDDDESQRMLSLARDFYAVSVQKYQSWEDFLGLIALSNEAVIKQYELSYTTRVGLRYINRVTSGNTGITNRQEFLDVFHPELTRMLRGGGDDLWDDPLESLNQVVLPGNNNERLTMRTGFRLEEDKPFFLLDFDYFIKDDEKGISIKEVPELCNYYHEVIYKAFRWSVNRIEVFNPEERKCGIVPHSP